MLDSEVDRKPVKTVKQGCDLVHVMSKMNALHGDVLDGGEGRPPSM